MRTLFKTVSFLVLFFAFSTAMLAASLTKTKYTITITDPKPRAMSIKASFVLQDQILAMNEYGADQFPERWAKFVRNLKATDADGRPLAIEALPNAQWRVDAKMGEAVNISYDVELEHEQYKWASGIDGVSFVRDWGVFCVGRTYLITNGTDRTNIDVSFDLPKKWHVTSPWKPLIGSETNFIARNLIDLKDSMFFAGTHDEFKIKRKGFDLIFALGGGGIAKFKSEYERLATGALDYYTELMGGLPHPPPGTKFDRVVVIINPGSDTDGEVIGNHISMIFNPDGDAQSQVVAKFIFAHEFFHLWNGKSINVATAGEEWFKEGITNYYALKALSRLKAVTDQDLFGTMNGLFYQRYTADTALGRSSMRDVASGDEKHKHWGLIYGGGLFTGICQDVDIRVASQNKRSLDDLMRDYFKRLGGTDKEYTTTDVRDSMAALGSSSSTDFINKHVFGTEKIPIEQCLSKAGLNANLENGQLKIARKNKPTKSEAAIISGIFGN